MASNASGITSDEGGPQPGPVLFVGNISTLADVPYIQRLFSAYGHVRDVRLAEGNQYALVVFQSHDDADSAIASLHLRYCMSPRVPLIVMYSSENVKVSEYGHLVSEEYRQALRDGREPRPIDIVRFDPTLDRGAVQLPPSELALPVPMAWRIASGMGAAANPQAGLFP